jgi:hypothetical protein
MTVVVDGAVDQAKIPFQCGLYTLEADTCSTRSYIQNSILIINLQRTEQERPSKPKVAGGGATWSEAGARAAANGNRLSDAPNEAKTS